MNDKITTIDVAGRSFDVFALPSYVTPYYYVPAFSKPGTLRRVGGPANNYQTIKQLTAYVRRQLTAR